MRVPQLNERVKEAPAHALRAVFGGIGSLLSVSDKIRNKPTASQAAATAQETAPAAAPETAAPADAAVPEDAATPATTETPAPTITSEPTITPETTATATATASAGNGAALPLANYDDLSIASLRARLRTLSPEQLTQLIDYEKAHADRADVISMFERRITKINLGLTQALPKVTE